MSLLDFFKNKKSSEKSKKIKPKKTVKKTESDRPEIKATKNVKGFSYNCIKNPHISEKATYLSEKDQYVFDIIGGLFGSYNKEEIKKAVEGTYGVDVLSVKIIKIPAKKRRLGKIEGFRKAYKKAIVKIKKGQKIEIL